MIRSSFWRSVYFSLESHPFLEREDFVIREYLPNGQPHLKISCMCCPQWEFDFRVPQQTKGVYPYYEFAYSMSPGRYAEGENGVARGEDALISEIKEWMKRLHEDIIYAPIIRKCQRYSAGLRKFIERFEQVPDELLTPEELATLAEALDHIKDDLTEELQEIIDDTGERKQRTLEIRNHVQFLKQSLGSLTKRQWVRAFYVRLYKWKDRFGLKQLAVVTHVLEYLLPSGKSKGLVIFCDIAESVAEGLDKESNGKEIICSFDKVSRQPNLQ